LSYSNGGCFLVLDDFRRIKRFWYIDYVIQTPMSGMNDPPIERRLRLNEPAGRWLLATTVAASGLAFLLGSAVGVALPAIQAYFNSPLTGIQWITSAYLLPLSALMLIGGPLGDHYGRKRLFTIGLLLLILGSALSSVAGSIGWLVAFQFVAGIGSALMVPQTLAIINASFASNERGKVIGLWAGLSGAVSAGAPWIGGILTQGISWRAVFLIPVPVGLIVFLMARRYVIENHGPGTRSPNWWMAVPVFAGLAAIVFALIRAPGAGFGDPLVLTGLFAGVLLIGFYILADRRQPNLILPLSIFRNQLVTGANLCTLLLYFALNGVLFFTVLNLQQIQGLSPSAAGLGLLPSVVLITLFSGPFGSLADRIGPRLQMIAGPGVAALGISLMAVFSDREGYAVAFLPGLTLIGLGMAMVIAPLTKSALSVEESSSGAASGLNNAVARIAALLAVAVLGALMSVVFVHRLDQVIDNPALTATERQAIVSQSSKLGGVVIPDDFNPAAHQAAESAVKSSFLFAFRWAMGTSAALALGAAVISFAGIHNPQADEQKEKASRNKEAR
jgi:MFS family permease